MSKIDYGFSVSENRQYVVPQDKDEREFILSVDRKTKGDVEERYNLHFNSDFLCNTVTYVVLENIIKSVGLNSLVDTMAGSSVNRSTMFNFYDLVITRLSNKQNENAEKEGNINISFLPGEKAVEFISATEMDDNHPREIVDVCTFDDPQKTELYINLDRLAKYQLSTMYGVTIPDNLILVPFAIAATFIENIYKLLLHNLAADNETSLVSINYHELIEFHAMEKGDGVIFALKAGYKSKLIVKSDERTESDLDDR